jgi:hypothetical protein
VNSCSELARVFHRASVGRSKTPRETISTKSPIRCLCVSRQCNAESIDLDIKASTRRHARLDTTHPSSTVSTAGLDVVLFVISGGVVEEALRVWFSRIPLMPGVWSISVRSLSFLLSQVEVSPAVVVVVCCCWVELPPSVTTLATVSYITSSSVAFV